MNILTLRIDVPITAFRPNWSREYQDTYYFPPPSTIYNMLLSLTGTDWTEKQKYSGIEIAIALEGSAIPFPSKVFKKFRRLGQSSEADPLSSRRPDYQEILLNLIIWIWLNNGKCAEDFLSKVKTALNKEKQKEIIRYGGLSLGESSFLINSIRIEQPAVKGLYLYNDDGGSVNLPVWVHHPRCGEGLTKLMSFSISKEETLLCPGKNDPRWIEISS